MKTDIINTKKVKVLVVTRDNCKDCDELIKKLQSLDKVMAGIELVIYNLSNIGHSESHPEIPVRVIITPALFINGRLKHYGDISSEKLKKFIVQ
jgi:predicted thioredoxin/glutaredoxin